jgi:two-component SAPR family response regulator
LDLARKPDNSVATFNLGLIVFQYEHKDSLGVALWKKAIVLDSNFAQPYKVLSQYYQAVGDSTNAISYRSHYRKKASL